MNAVGIDVSKGKSTVAVLRPFGEVVASPFDVIHNDNDLKRLVKLIRSLPGESKVVMEYTGTYFEPIAQFLHNSGKNPFLCKISHCCSSAKRECKIACDTSCFPTEHNTGNGFFYPNGDG